MRELGNEFWDKNFVTYSCSPMVALEHCVILYYETCQFWGKTPGNFQAYFRKSFKDTRLILSKTTGFL